jgi:hypothetical protein
MQFASGGSRIDALLEQVYGLRPTSNGIARRVLCRWKQELAPPVFVAVQITDATAPSGAAPANEEHAP